MAKIKKSIQEIIDNMNKTIVSTIKFYRDMQTDEIYAEKYSEANLKKEVEAMAKAYNTLLANQYGVCNHISKKVYLYDSIYFE